MKITHKAWLVVIFAAIFASIAGMWIDHPVHAQTAWSATVLSKTSDTNGNQTVAVHFADASGHSYDVNHTIPFGAASTDLADWTASMITLLSAQRVAYAATPSVGATITPTAASAADPNAAIKAQFLSDYALLRECQTAQSHGITTVSLGACATILATVQTEWTAHEAVFLPLVSTAP